MTQSFKTEVSGMKIAQAFRFIRTSGKMIQKLVSIGPSTGLCWLGLKEMKSNSSKTHFFPTKQGCGKSVSLMERRKQIIFSCFLLLKNWCVLWKGASYGAKNTVCKISANTQDRKYAILKATLPYLGL